MDHRQAHVRRGLVAALLLVAAGSVSAYVSPSPPPGFGGSPGSWTFSPASPSGQLNSILRGPGPSVAGSGAMSAAYRLGPGAARALAGVVVGGGVAGALLLGGVWLANNCFEKQGSTWVRTCGGTPQPQSDGYEYKRVGTATWFKQIGEFCAEALNYNKTVVYPQYAGRTWNVQYCSYPSGVRWGIVPYPGFDVVASVERRVASGCPAGWYITPAGCVQTPPPQTVTPQQVIDEMAEKPLPQTLPPGVPYPLDPSAPSIWNPTIGDPPTTQPLRVPQGAPQPIPNTNPQKYRQPITEVTHSPTADDPWRMDVQPKEGITESPTGQTGPESVTSGSPPVTPDEDKSDLCKLHPEILACADLDTPEAPDLKTEERGGPITPDSGWGGESAACPAPRQITVQGRLIPIPYDLFCTYMSGIRPLVIAMAWLSAGFILLGRKGGD